MKFKSLWLLTAVLPVIACADNSTVTLTCPNTSTVSVYSTQFVATSQIPVTQAKIVYVANATLGPQNIAAFMQSLETLKDAQNNALVIKTLSQNKTDSGLVNVVATLEDIVPINDSGVSYQFAATHSNAGVQFTVDSITPYLSVDDKNNAKHALEFQLYQKAIAFQKQINGAGGQQYHIVSFDTNPNPMPTPQPMVTSFAMARMANTSESAPDGGNMGAGISVNQTLTLTAQVTYNGS